MTGKIDIPQEELQQFKPFVQIFSRGKEIIREGDERDQRIFLLRQGSVDVVKQIGDQREVVGRIEAVNLFGEMSIVTKRPRTASIIAASDPVVIYAFDNPNLSVILANPKWGNLLVRRLAENLEKRHKEFEAAQLEVMRLRTAVSDMVGAILTLYAVSGKDEMTQKMFLESLPKLVGLHMKGLGVVIKIPDQNKLQKYKRLEIISELLYRFAMVTRSKLKDDTIDYFSM